MARDFADAARSAGVERIVYLGGLHPADEDLSDHLRSRVEVGEILMGSGVPTAALQAGVVLGDGSSSFTLLRHLSERLPGAIAPQWITNDITPISVIDAVFFLVKAADLPAVENRTFDIGGPDTMPYFDMMKRYSTVVGLPPHPIVVAPIGTVDMAAHYLAMVTPISSELLRPLLGSLMHDTVVKERDLEELVGVPTGGLMTFEEAVADATVDIDTGHWYRMFGLVAGAVTTGAVAETVLAENESPERLLGRVLLTADLAVMSSLTLSDTSLGQRGYRAESTAPSSARSCPPAPRSLCDARGTNARNGGWHWRPMRWAYLSTPSAPRQLLDQRN